MHARRKDGAATAPNNNMNSKRNALHEALVSKLVHKYAKKDDDFARIIGSLVTKLVKSSTKLVEADISALEKTVKKLSDERSRKERREQERPGFQPQHTDSLDEKVAEMKPMTAVANRSQSRSGEIDLKSQDEWVLINALNSVEFENSERLNMEKKHSKTIQQRQWLDLQKREKENKVQQVVEEKHEMYEHQVSDYTKWKREEQEKSRKARDVVDHIRIERDRQLRESKDLHAKQEEKRRREEEIEVQRCKDELKRTEMEALERKKAQHIRMQALLKENIQVQHEKERKKILDQEQDVKLMEDYAKKLAKEEAQRIAALQHKLTRQDRIQNGIALSIHEELKQKELDDERRADEYQRKKLENERKKEEAISKRRKEEAMERKNYLTFQHDLKEDKKKKLIHEEVEYSTKYRQEGEIALREMKQKDEISKIKNKEYQKLLLKQMEEQKLRKAASFKSMDARERSLNALLLRKLDGNEELNQKIIEKLSPDKMVRAKPRNNIF